MMTVNDIIVLLTLIIALLAIINEKKRSHLLLKFHWIDYIIFFVSFALINYFVFYPSFYAKGLFFGSLYFIGFGFKEPRHYAYLVTILSLGYLLYKIWKSFYSFGNFEKVDKFYKKLLEDNEISLLLDLVEHYHKKDIIRYVKTSKDYDENEDRFEVYRRFTTKQKIIDRFERTIRYLVPYSWYNRRAYASYVLFNLVNSPGFINQGANMRPYFFADIISNFTKAKRDAYPRDLINNFFGKLIDERNFWLEKELKRSEDFDSGQPDFFHQENKILSSVISDLTVADVNNVWQPFGNSALKEIELAKLNVKENKLFERYLFDEQLWEFKTYFAIQFLKILVTEAINKSYTDSHFWLYYYDRIIRQIVLVWEPYLNSIPDDDTIAHKFVEVIYDNLLSWLHLSNQKKDTWLYENILDSIGGNRTATSCSQTFASFPFKSNN